jgi:hypothetical protein
VLDLRHVQVGIAVVDELVEQLDAFPDAHLRLVQPRVSPGRSWSVAAACRCIHRLAPCPADAGLD